MHKFQKYILWLTIYDNAMSIRYKDLLLILVYSLTTSYSLMLKLYEIITILPTLDSYWRAHYIHSFHNKYRAICIQYHFLSKFQAKYQNYFIVLTCSLLASFSHLQNLISNPINILFQGRGRQHINQIFT